MIHTSDKNNDMTADTVIADLPELPKEIRERGFFWVMLPAVWIMRDDESDCGTQYVFDVAPECCEEGAYLTLVDTIKDAYVVSASFAGSFYRLGAGRTPQEALDMALINYDLW